MSNRRYNQFYYTSHNYPVQLDCSWTVDSTQAIGISGLTGAGIQNVYMHSAASFTGDTHTTTVVDGISSTAALAVGMPVYGTGIPVGAKIATITSSTAITLTAAASATNAGVTISYAAVGNPNPASGYAIVQFQDCFNGYYFGGAQVQSPLSGAEISISGSSVLTVGAVYVITTVGTSSAANWQAMGLPVGITPAVGVPFVASATGSGTGTGKVKINAAAGAGISMIDVVGSPNTSIVSSATSVPGISSGSYMILRFLGIQAPTFTGSALGTHAHDLLIKGGQAASTTNDLAHYATDILGKEAATDATILGSASATKGGVLAVTAGTPAGSISTPALAAAAPAAGSIIKAHFVFSNSRIQQQGS